MRPIAKWGCMLMGLALAGCATGPKPKDSTAYQAINSDLDAATTPRPARPVQDPVLQSLLPPITAEMPRAETADLGQRFDLTVTNAPAPQVLNAIVSGTSYSMVIHPGIKEPVSLSLKNVTIPEVLNTVRELYGYDYRIEGTLIYVVPAALQTRIYKIDYLTSNRRGSSDLRVSSNVVNTTSASTTGSPGGAAGGAGAGGAGGGGGQVGTGGAQSTLVETATHTDFWRETFSSLAVLTGCTQSQPAGGGAGPQVNVLTPQPGGAQIWGCDGLNGRRLVVSPQSGSILVRAMPDELKSVTAYLRNSQATIERQVLIEAKILEVALRDGYETGINWAGFFTKNPGETAGVGFLTPGTQLGTTGSNTVLQGGNPASRTFPTPLTAGTIDPFNPLGASGRAMQTALDAAGSIFGIAIQTKNFAALMTFLESQGVVHTLSSPRIATMNNQKAVLKVGSDSLFVTRITGGSTTATQLGVAPTVTSPTFEVQSFFSGIALDVTPRIADDGSILLHVRPSITDVTQQSTTFNLGVLGSFTIPLVSNAVSETDSVIRATDGQIVAIGGLMRIAQRENRNQVPGLGNLPYLGAAFRNTAQQGEKRELVILLKPSIVQSDESWARNILDSRDRVRSMDRGFSWGGRAEVFGAEREGWVPPK